MSPVRAWPVTLRPASPREVAHQALRLSRPLPARRDASTSIPKPPRWSSTRPPRVGAGTLAQRLCPAADRARSVLLGSLAALDSVPGVGPKLLGGLAERDHLLGGGTARALTHLSPQTYVSSLQPQRVAYGGPGSNHRKTGRYPAPRGAHLLRTSSRKPLAEQKASGMRPGLHPGEARLRRGDRDHQDAGPAVSDAPRSTLSRFRKSTPRSLKLIPGDIAWPRHTVLPLKREGRTPSRSPSGIPTTSRRLRHDIKFITRCDIFPVIAGEYTLRNAIDKYYQQSDAPAAEPPQERRGGRRPRGGGGADRRGRQERRPGGRCAGREAHQRHPGRRGDAGRVRHSHRVLRARAAGALPGGRRPAGSDEAALEVAGKR